MDDASDGGDDDGDGGDDEWKGAWALFSLLLTELSAKSALWSYWATHIALIQKGRDRSTTNKQLSYQSYLFYSSYS